MKIKYINQDGSSYGQEVEVGHGTTVCQFVSDKTGGRSSGDYIIRVNSKPALAEQVLNEGDFISLTPKKVTGA